MPGPIGSVKVLVVKQSEVEAAIGEWVAENSDTVAEVLQTTQRVVKDGDDPEVAVTILYRPK